jgi:hypothetical protein
MPVGAARDRALADLTTQMYSTVGGAQAGAVQQAPTTLANIGSSLGNISLQELGAMLSGYQGGAQTNANAGQMAAQQQQSLLNFFGNLAGAGAGLISPIKLCWVAEAIYGPCDMRTFAVRAWLRGRFRKTFAGICATTLYAIIGQPVGWLAQRSPRLRATLKPLFDRALCAAVSLTA